MVGIMPNQPKLKLCVKLSHKWSLNFEVHEVRTSSMSHILVVTDCIRYLDTTTSRSIPRHHQLNVGTCTCQHNVERLCVLWWWFQWTTHIFPSKWIASHSVPISFMSVLICPTSLTKPLILLLIWTTVAISSSIRSFDSPNVELDHNMDITRTTITQWAGWWTFGVLRQLVSGASGPRGAWGRTLTLSVPRAISGPSCSIRSNPETHPIAPAVGTFGWFLGDVWVSGTLCASWCLLKWHLGPLCISLGLEGWGAEVHRIPLSNQIKSNRA